MRLKTLRYGIAGTGFVHYIMDKTGKVHTCRHSWGKLPKKLEFGYTKTIICKKYGIKFIGEV